MRGVQDTGHGFSPLPICGPSWTDASPALLLRWPLGTRASDLLEVMDKALCLLKLQFAFRRRKWELELLYLVSRGLLCAGRQWEGVEEAPFLPVHSQVLPR